MSRVGPAQRDPAGGGDVVGSELRRLAALLRWRLEEVVARRESLVVSSKTAPYDLVTDADRSIEDWLFHEIHSAFPADGFLGEERGWRAGPSGSRDWLVDPIDGTVNVVNGIPWGCASIGLVGPHGPLAGLVVDPFRGDAYLTASAREGTELNGTPVEVAPGGELGGKVVLLEVPSGWPPGVLEPVAAAVLERGGSIRAMGSGALALALVAAGRAQAAVHAGPAPWDVAAGIALVRHAGGTVLGPSGDGNTARSGPMVAGSAEACALLHEALASCELGAVATLPTSDGIEPG